jgi:hypothetical protein
VLPEAEPDWELLPELELEPDEEVVLALEDEFEPEELELAVVLG